VNTSHAEGIHAAVVASRPELLPWMPWAREPSLPGALAAAERGKKAWKNDEVFHFAVVDKRSRDVLGIAGLNREGPDAAELHYWIRSDRAGRGLTTEACRALIAWARDELRVSRLTLWAGRENKGSRRVAEKVGFAHLGPLGWRPEGGLGVFDAESYELRFSS